MIAQVADHIFDKIRDRVRSSYPVATTMINITGPLLLGLLTGVASQQLLPHQWQLSIGTGFLGGYTTFSTTSFETLGLLEDRRYAGTVLREQIIGLDR